MNRAFRSTVLIIVSLLFNISLFPTTVKADEVTSTVTVEDGEVKGTEIQATDVLLLFVSSDCAECEEISTYFQKTLGTGGYNLQTEDVTSNSGAVLYDKAKVLCEDPTNLPILSYGENCFSGSKAVRAEIAALAENGSTNQTPTADQATDEETQQESTQTEDKDKREQTTRELKLSNFLISLIPPTLFIVLGYTLVKKLRL